MTVGPPQSLEAQPTDRDLLRISPSGLMHIYRDHTDVHAERLIVDDLGALIPFVGVV